VAFESFFFFEKPMDMTYYWCLLIVRTLFFIKY